MYIYIIHITHIFYKNQLLILFFKITSLMRLTLTKL